MEGDSSYAFAMASPNATRRTRLLALGVTAAFALAGLSACSSSDSDAPATGASETSDTSMATKNGVMRTTTTTVPSTMVMPMGGAGNKPKR